MTRFALHVRPPTRADERAPGEHLYWLDGATADSTFQSPFGPRLGLLGPVPAGSVDFLRLALSVYAADRSVMRRAGGSDWNQRDIELRVAVSDPDRWSALADELAHVIGFLSGDAWSLEFTRERPRREEIADSPPRSDRVLLLSGGADSAVGALASRDALGRDGYHTLVSHFSHTNLSPIQKATADAAERLIPGPGQRHVSIRLSRRAKRIDGSRLPSEPSSRSRSLLFIALALAAASVDQAPVWIAENGFASLNPPLGPESRGTLSTRTTHPRFLQDLASILGRLGVHNVIHNPFADMTKGEMFSRAAELVGPGNASRYLSATNSCAHTGQRAFAVSTTTPCGVCFGCVLRRAAFAASGIRDATRYANPTDHEGLRRWLEANSVETAVRNFVRRGVNHRDMIALSLPDNYPLATALDLCRRSVDELAVLLPS